VTFSGRGVGNLIIILSSGDRGWGGVLGYRGGGEPHNYPDNLQATASAADLSRNGCTDVMMTALPGPTGAVGLLERLESSILADLKDQNPRFLQIWRLPGWLAGWLTRMLTGYKSRAVAELWAF